MLELRKSQDRGTGKQDWLEARFTFSFGPYQDPEQNGFSDLKLLNDDRVAPGGGFATHSHQDMEVFSYVLAGALEHKDSMGEGSVVTRGRCDRDEYRQRDHAQRVQSFEVRASAFFPDLGGAGPAGRRAAVSAEAFSRRRKARALAVAAVACMARMVRSVFIRTRGFTRGLFDGKENFGMGLGAGTLRLCARSAGKRVALNGTALAEGDGARVRGERQLVFDMGRDAEVLVFDLRA